MRVVSSPHHRPPPSPGGRPLAFTGPRLRARFSFRVQNEPMLSSAGGFSILVPGYFVCSGILVFAALAATAVGVHRGRVPLYLAFAATCLFSAGIAAATASYYLADSVDGAVASIRFNATCSTLMVLSIFSFLYLYVDRKSTRLNSSHRL